MITQLSFSNFKSWKKVAKMRLAPITGFFGANSSGKTSVLQLLMLLKQTAESADRMQALHFGDHRTPANLGGFRDVLHAHDAGQALSWRMTWDLPEELRIQDPERENEILFAGKEMTFASEVRENGAGKLIVPSMSYGFARHVFSMTRREVEKDAYDLKVEPQEGFRFIRYSGRPWPLPAPVKCYGFPNEVNTYYQNAGFLGDFQLAFDNAMSRIKYLGPLRDDPKREYTWAGTEPPDMGKRGERFVDGILSARERGRYIARGRRTPRWTLEEAVATWLKRLRLVANFSVEAIAAGSNLYRVNVQRTAHSAPVLITDVGFGVSQILPVIALCYFVPEGSVILLEQPEIHLHPSVQADLADVLVDAVKCRKIQIVFESHSEHLLRRFQRRIAEQTLARDQTAFYFCESVNGRSELTQLDVDLYGSIKNWPKEFFGDEFGEMAAITRAAIKHQKAADV